MDPLRTVARTSLGAVFISGGIDSLRSPEPKAAVAAPVTELARDAVDGLPESDVTLVRINAGVHVAAGSLLALGKLPRHWPSPARSSRPPSAGTGSGRPTQRSRRPSSSSTSRRTWPCSAA
jgi:hypothetical protein